MGEWLVMVVPRAPRLPVKVSVVAIGSVVLPAVFDKYSMDVVAWGSAAAIWGLDRR